LENDFEQLPGRLSRSESSHSATTEIIETEIPTPCSLIMGKFNHSSDSSTNRSFSGKDSRDILYKLDTKRVHPYPQPSMSNQSLSNSSPKLNPNLNTEINNKQSDKNTKHRCIIG
jgi:hypothetical protein